MYACDVGVELLASHAGQNTCHFAKRSGHCKNLESDAPTSQYDLRTTTDHITVRLRPPIARTTAPEARFRLIKPKMSFARASSKISRAAIRAPVYRSTPVAWNAQRAFSQSAVRASDAHAEETFEEFTARYDASVGELRTRTGDGAVRSQTAAIELWEALEKLCR